MSTTILLQAIVAYYKEPVLAKLELSRKRSIIVEVFKAVNNLSPGFMCDLFKPKHVKYNLRNKSQLCVTNSRTTRYGLQSLSNYGARLWNSLPQHMKNCSDLLDFKTMVQSWTGSLCKCIFCRD